MIFLNDENTFQKMFIFLAKSTNRDAKETNKKFIPNL